MMTENDTISSGPGAQPTVDRDPWDALRGMTDARIALGRCGAAPPMAAVLDFRLAHARARDAVHCPFRSKELAEALSRMHPCLLLESRAPDRISYLSRPDWGRQLSDSSIQVLDQHKVPQGGYDIVMVLADGLSAQAMHTQSIPFLQSFLRIAEGGGLKVAPLCLVTGGRVAIADPIGQALQCKVSAILVGERPGLSAPDSMGIYLTHSPRQGKTDESRNCLSNIRKGGMDHDTAARKLAYLIEESLRMGFSGVRLKDSMPQDYLPFCGEMRLAQDT